MKRISFLLLLGVFSCMLAMPVHAEPADEVKLSTFGQEGARRSDVTLAGVKLIPGKSGGFFRSNCGVKVADTAQFEFEFQSSVSGNLRLAVSLAKDGKKTSVSLKPVACPGGNAFRKVIFELTELPGWNNQDTLEDLELRFTPDDPAAVAVVGFQHAKFTKNAPTTPAEKAQAELAASGRLPVKLHSFGNVGARVTGYTVACKLQPGKAGGAFRPNDHLAVDGITQLTFDFKSSVPGAMRLATGLVLKDGKSVSVSLPTQAVSGNNTRETLVFDLTELPNFDSAQSFMDLELRFTPDSSDAAEIEFSNAAFTNAEKKN